MEEDKTNTMTFEKATKVRDEAKVQYNKHVASLEASEKLADKLQGEKEHFEDETERLTNEKRELDIKSEDQDKKTKEALTTVEEEKAKVAKFTKETEEFHAKRLNLEQLTKEAHEATVKANEEHDKQVQLKETMLKQYAELMKKDLEEATEKVEDEEEKTEEANDARTNSERRTVESLKKAAEEKARKESVVEEHELTREEAAKVANKNIKAHEVVEEEENEAAKEHIVGTLKASKATEVAKTTKQQIVEAAKLAAENSAKLICNIRLAAAMKRHMFDSEMCDRSKKFLNKLTDEEANPKRLESEKEVVKFWCTARNARREQVKFAKECKSSKFKAIAMHNENMANVATLAAWGSPAQKKIPKNGKGTIRYKTWYANVMKLASSLSHTPCGAMPGAPASININLRMLSTPATTDLLSSLATTLYRGYLGGREYILA